jgi:hypothetical protein
VAMMHHPLEYLAEHNRFDCKALLQKHFNLICTGHLHQPMPEVVTSPVGQSVRSEAGCLYTNRSYHNGYCFIKFDLTTRKVDFIHRRWEDSPRLAFAEANIVCDKGRTQFYWGNPGEVHRIGQLLDVNKQLRPILTDQANEHMLSEHTNTSEPKLFKEIYVDVHVSDQ